MKLPVEYVLPLRWEDDADLEELTAYLDRLVMWADVTVVDGSDAALFARHRRAWPMVRHVRPAGAGRNGKARGAMTGIRLARHDVVVVADDDVRYGADDLARLVARLDEADFVRPQNVFVPMPWHARWDTGRSLLNRAGGGDFGGTVGLRVAALGAGGYDTDVLFENLELERTVRARGGRVQVARNLIITRRPPTLQRFVEQRVRQAYDGFGQPLRLLRELALLPALIVLVGARRWRALAGSALFVVGVAAYGRLRGGGRHVFPPTACLWAPVWVLERALMIWVAVGARLRGGIRYRDARLRVAAHSIGALRRRVHRQDR